MDASTRRARRLLRWALGVWPADARRRVADVLLATFEDEVGELGLSGLRLWLRACGEAGAIVRGGLSLQWQRVRRGVEAGVSGVGGDVRHALRGLRRNAGFTATVGLTLALGIGANATVYSIVHRVLFALPDFESPGELVVVWQTLGSSGDRVRVPAPDVPEIARAADGLEVVAFSDRVVEAAFETGDGSGAEPVKLASVSPDFFRVFGTPPLLGRAFSEGDASVESARPAVVSHRLWSRLLGRDSAAIGREVRVDGTGLRVIGIMPAGFRIRMPPGTGVASDPDLWIPIPGPLSERRRNDGRLIDQDSDNTGVVVGRLRPGATHSQVQSRLDELAARLRDRFDAYDEAEVGLLVRPMHEDATRHLSGVLEVLLSGVGILLMVTCLNVATLLMARRGRRAREHAVREALGAGRIRLVRLRVVETSILIGAGLALSALASSALSAWLLRRDPGLLDVARVEVSPGTLLAIGGLVSVVMCVVGVLPSPPGHRPPGPGERLRRGRRPIGGRHLFVGLQVALSVSLLLATFLLLRSASELGRVDPGFDTQGALTLSISLRTPGRYPGPADRAEVVRELTDRLAALPGVRAAGAITHLPLSERRWSQPWGEPGQPPEEWTRERADFRAVSSDLFDALGAPILAGRSFTRTDDLHEERRVVVVDRLIAERLGGVDRALGATIGIPLDGDPVAAEIIGVAEHVRFDRLDADGRGTIYVPYRQEASRDVSFVLRAPGVAEALAPGVRETVHALDPQFAVHGLGTFEDHVDRAIGPVRFGVEVLGIFALLALIAVGIGLYGGIALEVARQRRDIGLRIAIGAPRPRVVIAVLRRTAWTVAAGCAAGALVAWLALRPLAARLFGTELTDPGVWAATLATVSAVALLASWLPARQAARVQPAEVLRSD